MSDDLLRLLALAVVIALMLFGNPRRKRASPGHRRPPTTDGARSDTRDRYLDIERRLKRISDHGADKDDSPKSK